MAEEIVIENRIDENGIRHLHVMSDKPISDRWRQMLFPENTTRGFVIYQDKLYVDDVRLHHLELAFTAIGIVDVHAEGWPKFRRMIMRPLVEGDRMSLVIEAAVFEFAKRFHFWPGYAFTHKLPREVENGVEVSDVLLFEAEWMIPRYVAVGGSL